MNDPTGPLNPFIQCFRCGYWLYDYIENPEILQERYIMMIPPVDDGNLVDNILRYGPDFRKKFNIISHKKPDGSPVKCCSMECCLDSLSCIYENDEESFTISCIMLSKIYNVRIPGLDLHIDGPQILIKNLNKDPKLLSRWGGNQTYEMYRVGFTMPDFKLNIPVDDEIHTGRFMEDLLVRECESASESEANTESEAESEHVKN